MIRLHRVVWLAVAVFVGVMFFAPVDGAQAQPKSGLKWVAGTVNGFTFQPKEQFYTAGIKTPQGVTFVRFCNPANGAPVALTGDNVLYELLMKAYDKGKSVQVGYYDFGPDPQAGINKNCIDRVVF